LACTVDHSDLGRSQPRGNEISSVEIVPVVFNDVQVFRSSIFTRLETPFEPSDT
jgi:hypothetical protein